MIRSRSGQFDLLVRPPMSLHPRDGWPWMIIDPVAQIVVLSDLHRRGLLTDEEFVRQKDKVLP